MGKAFYFKHRKQRADSVNRTLRIARKNHPANTWMKQQSGKLRPYFS